MLKELKDYLCKLCFIMKLTHGAFLLALVFFVLSLPANSNYSVIECFKTLEITSAMAIIAAIYYGRIGLVFANAIIMVFVFIQIIAM